MQLLDCCLRQEAADTPSPFARVATKSVFFLKFLALPVHMFELDRDCCSHLLLCATWRHVFFFAEKLLFFFCFQEQKETISVCPVYRHFDSDAMGPARCPEDGSAHVSCCR